jgi:hypothetical protein
MNGYETVELVQAAITALERERRGHTSDQRHRDQIEEQLKLFKRELKRLERLEAKDEPKPRQGRSTLIRNATTGRDYQEWIN